MTWRCLAAVRSFFTIGYHSSVSRVSGLVLQQDGFVSSLMACLLLTAFSVAFTTSRYFSLGQTKPVRRQDVQVFTGFLMLVNTCGLFVVTCCRHVRGRITFTGAQTTTDTNRRKRKLQVVIPLFGLFLFLVGILAMELSRSVCHLICLVRADGYIPQHRFAGWVSFLYHVIKSVFTVAVFLFICVFSASSRQETPKVQLLGHLFTDQ